MNVKMWRLRSRTRVSHFSSDICSKDVWCHKGERWRHNVWIVIIMSKRWNILRLAIMIRWCFHALFAHKRVFIIGREFSEGDHLQVNFNVKADRTNRFEIGPDIAAFHYHGLANDLAVRLHVRNAFSVCNMAREDKRATNKNLGRKRCLSGRQLPTSSNSNRVAEIFGGRHASFRLRVASGSIQQQQIQSLRTPTNRK